ncbi:hypothetical protein SAMN04488082_104123 [Desulfomicrobium apsheronum]|uniref:Uncharacterized protein n=1 Tax=Desulfomicrobium apsheronum TaxID=52560 RepID=A0A1I3SGE5_9BACT|nr:hypothetical protein [Desulfomicrobium apsheronum]SFJ56779.1 hypothetical protein SAMN04488082_104123 [Desulfomicrobium apsheronum]
MIFWKFIQFQGHIHSVLMLLCWALFATIIPAQGVNASETATTTQPGVPQDTDAALRDLAEKNALTVRALVGYGRISASAMAPLAGLRGKGIDVLGATPEQLDVILQEHGATLTSEERKSLDTVANAMRDVGTVVTTAPPEAAPADMDVAGDVDDDLLNEEVAIMLASDPGPEDWDWPAEIAHFPAVAVSLTASNVYPVALPPMKPTPFLDINALTPTQWDGAVAAAMEGMRMVYGPLSDAEEESFRKTWGVLRQHPSPEAVEYLNRFNPLLGEFLSLRGAVPDASARLEHAVEQISWAMEANDPAMTLEALTLARMHRNTLLSCQKRLDEVIAELIALGDPPDGRALMAEGQQQYKRAKDFLRSLVEESGPEGEWVGYITHPGGYVVLEDKVINNSPFHALIYSVGEPKEYFCLLLEPGSNWDEDFENEVYTYVDNIDLTKFDLVASIQGDTLNYSSTDEDGETWSFHAQRYTGGPLPTFPDLSRELFEEALVKNERIKEEQLAKVGQTDSAKKSFDRVLDAGVSHFMKKKFIENALAHYRSREAFHAAAVKWAAMGDEMAGSEEARLRQFDALVAGGAPQQVAETPKAKDKAQEPKEKESKESAEPAPMIAQGDTPLHMVDDQTEEDRRIIDQETIDFHSANVAIIQRNMEKDIAELAKETNSERRHDLEMRVLNAKANLQSEQDRIETLKTGVIVHTRSDWDDFARSQFIQKIAADQRNMEKVDRAMKKAFAMADTLPFDKAEQVRKIVAKGFSPEVMTATDTQKASQVIRQAYEVSMDHWEGEKKKADTDAEWADICLKTAEMTKSVADKSLMVLSFAGGSAVNRVYQGTIGYVEGGPKEAFLRVGGSYNQLTGVAVDSFRGFEAAVQSGGGWEEGFKGAGLETLKGLAMDAAMQLGVRGVASGYGAVKNFKKSRGGNVPATAPKTSAGKMAAADAPPSGARAKPAGIPDDGFNRPLTEADRQVYKAQMADARTRVTSYKKTFDQLQKARREKASPTEIKKILRVLDDRSAKIHASPQAKMIMKTHQRSPKNKEMVKRFVNSMDRVHNRVEKTFHQKMGADWSPEDLTPIRNADQGKTVNTDFDIARQVKFDANGLPIPPKKNGRPVPESLWQADAQKKWNDSYRQVTGQDPKRSWETVTTGGHPEAYKDLALIEKNGVLRANKAWAGQSADVNQFKGDHLRGDPNFNRIESHVEIARSTAKECQKRLTPLMETKAPPRTDKANFEAFTKHKEYWENMNRIMDQMGSGRIDPLEGDRRIRLLSGGKSSLEVTHDLRDFLESLIKFGK